MNKCKKCGLEFEPFYYYVQLENGEFMDEQCFFEYALPVKVAVDCYGQRIPFAIEDDDTVMSEEEYYAIHELKCDCGVNWSIAKDAYMYAKRRNGDYKMMVAYCKARVCTVKLDEPLDKRVQKFMEAM